MISKDIKKQKLREIRDLYESHIETRAEFQSLLPR